MLFQIEEPDGSPLDAEGPGVAVGIDLSGARAGVAVAIGGNAEALVSPDGASGPETSSLRDAAGAYLEEPCTKALQALRGLAERALSRPVTHVVLVVPVALGSAGGATLTAAATASGLVVTRVLTPAEAAGLAGVAAPLGALYGAAIAAEDDSFALGRS
ncbi:MAG: hypothetical protein JWL84_2767 [Rhodospirillales bacterium]|jgi:hypothetical protein|nr:hypothetical protein [Rhodospirillales bacterium]